MEFDELLITTGVDALVRLVKDKQRVELDDASITLNIQKETLEEWARVLEEERILKIEYRLAKLYLTWVKPTEEEIVVQRQTFYEEKKNVVGEVEQFKQKITAESSELDGLKHTFSDFYNKTYTKMAEFEKAVSASAASTTVLAGPAGSIEEYKKTVDDIEKQIQDVRIAVNDMQNEISELGVGSTEQQPHSKSTLDRIERMKEEVTTLQQELFANRKRAAQTELPSGDGARGAGKATVVMPGVEDIRKKFETLQKEFAGLRAKNAQMRQDMISLHESSEILHSVAESIMGQEDKIGSLHTEVTELARDAEKLAARTADITAKVKKNAELSERLGDSVNVAKGILTRFPSQEKIMAELESVKAREDALLDKGQALERVLEAVGGKQVTAKQFAELGKRMDEKIEQMKAEMDGLEAALQSEKDTYITFQKIRERIVPSLEVYQKQLADMEGKLDQMETNAATQLEHMEADRQKIQESMKTGKLDEVMGLVEAIRGKRNVLDDIKNAMDELTESAENLNKKITLLSREANLLEIRTGDEHTAGNENKVAAPNAGKTKENEIRERLELSREEEKEFREKREELKKLISKLWEE